MPLMGPKAFHTEVPNQLSGGGKPDDVKVEHMLGPTRVSAKTFLPRVADIVPQRAN